MQQKPMRVRFRISVECLKPVIWPIQYPYWVTGYDFDFDFDNTATIVAYVTSEGELFKQWPELKELGYEVLETETDTEIWFSARFPKNLSGTIQSKP